ncbi:MAG: plasmid mobilization protein [Bacillota bacterium]
MIINGAWYLDSLPNEIVAELEDGKLVMFRLTPFRLITQGDLKDYKGHHPRKCKGQPLPEYLYRFYGLIRNEESLSEVIRVRVSPTEKEKLEAAASNAGKTVSEFLREYIRGL